MKLLIPKLLLVAISILSCGSLNAELVTETTVGSGYQGNLFSDSNSVGDSYSYLGLNLIYYPSASTQIKVGSQYNAFGTNGDLSNLNADLSMIVILTPDSSPISMAVAGSLAARKFGPLYQLYNQVGAGIGVDMGYRLSRSVYLQSSISYLDKSYTNSDFGSSRGYDLGGGINFTILGSNSIALKVNYSRRTFDQPTALTESMGNSSSNVQAESETFDVTESLLRYSRPLGERTGLNFSLGHRKLQMDNNYAVLGYTIDDLSPWSDLWDGVSYSASLKHILARQVTAELSYSYTDKEYIDALELGDATDDLYWQDSREDQLTSVSLSLSRSFLTHSGNQITPSIYLGYRSNQSTFGFFVYDDTFASLSLKIGF